MALQILEQGEEGTTEWEERDQKFVAEAED